MHTHTSKRRLIVSRIMKTVVVLFMAMDGLFKFFPNEYAIKGTEELGYQMHHLPIIGTLALAATILFAIPRTTFVGALLLTGFWGGVIATHVRMDNPLFSHILFPVYLAVLAWGAIFLTNDKVRHLSRYGSRRRVL